MIHSDQAVDHLEATVEPDLTSGVPETVLDLPGFSGPRRRRAYNLILSPARTEALRKLRNQVSTGTGSHETVTPVLHSDFA
jgi:hypothetical protein